MKDVALACGVSVVTVSRALRGDPHHSPETRQKIRETARAMGYRSNPLVAALMSERGRRKPGKATVNLGILNLGGDWETHAFYKGAIQQAEALGYRAELFPLAPGIAAAQRLRRTLQHRGVRALIVLPARKGDWHMEFDLEGFAAVTIGNSVISPAMPRVTTDTYARLLQAFREMARRGYRRLGLLSTPDLDHRFQHQITAAIEVFRKTGKSPTKIFCLETTPGANEVERRTLMRWVRRHQLDAILSQLGSQFETLTAANLRPPRPFGYLHLHRHPDPRVTQLDQMQEAIGRKAADVVIGMINRNEFRVPEHPQTVLIPSVWREGETCPPLPPRKAGRQEI